MRTVRRRPVVGLVAAAGLVALLGVTLRLSVEGWSAGVAVAGAAFVLLRRALDRRAVPELGPADVVTSARTGLVAGVAALVVSSFGGRSHVSTLVGLAAVALALDAVDGRVARRTRTTSALGARFDMEVDALLILILSVDVGRDLGWWVLAIGLARYAYVLAGLGLPWLREPASPRYWCKVVAAIQGVTLTVAAGRVLPDLAAAVAVAVAACLLAESFGREAWQLWCRHRALTSTAGARVPSRVHG